MPHTMNEQVEEPSPTAFVEIYKDISENWRWRLVASNGLIIAESGEGFVSKSNAKRSWLRVEEIIEHGEVTITPLSISNPITDNPEVRTGLVG